MLKKTLAVLAASGAMLATASSAEAANWVARHGLTSSEYQAEFDKWTQKGYRLSYVSGYDSAGTTHFAAIWDEKGGPAYVARHNLTAAEYQAEFDKQVAAGYRLVLVNGYAVGGGERFAAIWEKSNGVPWIARHGLSSSDYQTEFDKQVKAGFRLVHVSGYSSGGQERYAAIWEKKGGPLWIARHGLTSAQYQAEFDKQLKDGYRLVKVSGYQVGSQDKFAAIWEKSGGMFMARHDLDGAHYQQAFNDYMYSGYKPVVVSGYTHGGADRYAAVWDQVTWSEADLAHIDKVAKAALAKYDIPGLSFAIAKDGRLVFAKGYGLADKEANEPVDTGHRWRIASLSKAITAAAIFKLIDDKKGNIDEGRTIFGPNGLLGNLYGSQPYKKNITSIQLKHMLRHTEGGWPNDGNDPMFTNPSMSHAQLITWTLDNRPLDYAPGDHYAYSNFGYSVLGRVIEKVSGQPYDAYVKDKILGPVGVHDMVIAGNTKADRKPHEVVYYDGTSDSPYTMNVARMDSHGGWIATPIDLVRFAVHVDGFATKPDILSPASIKSMSTVATAKDDPGYACGWLVNSAGNWWHTGSLPGTSSITVRTSSGFVWSAIVNSRKNDPNLDQMMWDIVNGVKSWPTYDLF